MGWLRNLFSTVARGFAWLADAWVYVYNFFLKLWDTAWGRFVLCMFPFISIIIGTHKLASYVVAPIRRFFLNGAQSGFSGGQLDISALVCDWVSVCNYYFPLDECFCILVHMALILFGIWAVLAIVHLVKTAIGGWI